MAQIQESEASLKKAQKVCKVGFWGMIAAAVGEKILAAMGNPLAPTYALLFVGGSVPVLAVGYVVKQRLKKLGI